ncbi:MAG: MoaD/ThiS family protein [bacterium]|nr:MoaD/ThiS family protein [bacterium]
MAIRSEETIQLSENPSWKIVTVKVLLMGELKRWVGRREVEVELPAGSMIRSLGEKLAVLCGEAFARHALTKAGALQPHVAVFIDGVQIGRLDICPYMK